MPEDDTLSGKKEDIGDKIDFQTKVFDGSITETSVTLYLEDHVADLQ